MLKTLSTRGTFDTVSYQACWLNWQKAEAQGLWEGVERETVLLISVESFN